MASESTRVIVAIDFGTSRSGFAYAFMVDRKVIGWTDWPGQTMAYPKTLTQILYGPGREVVAWGFPAAQRWAELRRSRAADQYRMFRYFKMELHEAGEHGERGPVLHRAGEEFAVVDLVADYLREIKGMAWTKIGDATGGHLRQEEVVWCLTVPAIWHDAEKGLMRTAAQEAGLIGTAEADAERLLLVLEPEAAAVHCQEKDGHALPTGTRFMIVDCGGGTVDISSHELAAGHGMREVAPGTGGALGSRYVDQVFLERFLAEKISPEVLATFRNEEPLDFFEMVGDWERLKCNFDPDTTLGPSFLPFRPSLFRLLFQRFPKVYSKLEEEGNEDGISIQPAEMEAIFAPILGQIVAKVREELDRMAPQGCDVMYLVGGFSSSPLLVERLRAEFSGEIERIVVPPTPGAAVVEGAVSFGLDPSLIRSRRSRLTYGCELEYRFEPGVDPEFRKVWLPDIGEYACGRFNAFVKAGDVVEPDSRVSHVFLPVAKDQTEVILDFYATRKREVRYVDEPGVERIGSLRIEMPDLSGGVDREVKVTMNFGKTEIEVRAVDRTSGRKCRTTLSFTGTFAAELPDRAA